MEIAAPILAITFLLTIWQAPKFNRSRLTIAGQAGVAAFACIMVVNSAYFFSRGKLTSQDISLIRTLFPTLSPADLSLPILHYFAVSPRAIIILSKLLPTDFVMGIIYQMLHEKTGHYGYPAFILGKYSEFGWWYYFPVDFSLKTTIPFLFLSIISLGWCGYRAFLRQDFACRLLIIFLGAYSAYCMLSSVDMGIRYFLPAYPLMFIMGGGMLNRLIRLRRAGFAGMAVVATLLLWSAAEAAYAFPDYLAYKNELTLRRPNWKYLSASDAEWGDDARGLAKYLRARGEDSVQGALLGSGFTLLPWRIAYTDLVSGIAAAQLPTARYVAIGASYLNGSSVPAVVGGKTLTESERINFFDAYRRRKPTDIIGGSIYIFRND
jgi:hypothetical protein